MKWYRCKSFKALVLVFISLAVFGCYSHKKKTQQLESLKARIGTELLTESEIKALSSEAGTLEQLVDELQLVYEKKQDAILNWQLGEAYRMRHLLDEPGSWEESEKYLKTALAYDVKLVPAHVSLGELYLTGGYEWAQKAEREFINALEYAPSRDMADARRGLFLSIYYQGRWAEALEQADRYLAARPKDSSILKMRAMAETNLK